MYNREQDELVGNLAMHGITTFSTKNNLECVVSVHCDNLLPPLEEGVEVGRENEGSRKGDPHK